MQLTVTVVSPAVGRRADVLIDAVPETAVAQVAAELDRLMHGGPGSGVPALFVGGHRVPGDMRLADAPVPPWCFRSRRDRGGGCGSAAAPIRTTCSCGSAPPICPRRWN